MRQTSQHCFQVSVKDCVSTVKVESARDAKKTAESLQRDTRPLAAVTKLILSSWIQLLIPFLTSILWLWGVGYHSSCLSLCVCLCPCSFCHDQTSYLFLSPFPTLMCPLCDPITPLPFPLFPCGVVTCGSEQVRAAHLLAWGCLSTPGVTQTGSFVGLSLSRPRLIWLDRSRKNGWKLSTEWSQTAGVWPLRVSTWPRCYSVVFRHKRKTFV